MSEFFFKFDNYFFSTGTLTINKLDDGIPLLELPVTHLKDFNTGIFGKTAPSHSFVENDHEAKLVLVLSSSAANYNSGHNMFLLATFQMHLPMSLYMKKKFNPI